MPSLQHQQQCWRQRVQVSAEATQEQLEEEARSDKRIAQALADGKLIKTIVVPGRMVNFVVR